MSSREGKTSVSEVYQVFVQFLKVLKLDTLVAMMPRPMRSLIYVERSQPSDAKKSLGYRQRILYKSSGIINAIDPLALAYNLYLRVLYENL